MDNKLSSYAAVTGPSPTIVHLQRVSRDFAQVCARGILRAFTGRLILLNSDQDRRTEFLYSANVHSALRQYAPHVHTVVVSSESNNIYHQISSKLENLRSVEVRMPVLRSWSISLLYSTIGAYQDFGFVYEPETCGIIDEVLDDGQRQEMVDSHARPFSRPDHKEREVEIFPVICCRMLPVVMMPPTLSAQRHNANDVSFQGRFVGSRAHTQKTRLGAANRDLVPETEATRQPVPVREDVD